MTRRSRWILGGVACLAVIALGVGLAFGPGRPPVHASIAPEVGHLAPDFTLTDIEGHTVSLAEYRHHVVLVDFFATWCVPCRQEMPLLNKLYRAHAPTVQVLAVDMQEPRSDVQQFVRNLRLGFIPLLDPDLSVFNRYRVGVQPVSYWIDRQGFIRAVHYGPMDPSFIRRELHALRVT